MPKETRMFSVTFFLGDTIKTKIQSSDVKPLEAIALLELAKDQMMKSLRESTTETFYHEPGSIKK